LNLDVYSLKKNPLANFPSNWFVSESLTLKNQGSFIWFYPTLLWGFPGGSDGKKKKKKKICLQYRRPGFYSWVGKIPGEENGNPLQYPRILPGEFHGQRSLAGYSPWSCKESDMTEWLTPATVKTSFYFQPLIYLRLRGSCPDFLAHIKWDREHLH